MIPGLTNLTLRSPRVFSQPFRKPHTQARTSQQVVKNKGWQILNADFQRLRAYPKNKKHVFVMLMGPTQTETRQLIFVELGCSFLKWCDHCLHDAESWQLVIWPGSCPWMVSLKKWSCGYTNDHLLSIIHVKCKNNFTSIITTTTISITVKLFTTTWKWG